MSNGAIINPAPSPPSAPGIPQPVMTGDGETQAVFPDYTPIVPPPLIGEGGGPPPPFPPPTPPPIGEVPEGVLVGPAIDYAPVPPSIPGVVQPQFETGDEDVPLGSQLFPQFSTFFLIPPVAVDDSNFAIAAPGTPPWTAPPAPERSPPQIYVDINGWGPLVPPGAPTDPGEDGRFPRPTPAIAGVAAQSEQGVPSEEPPPERHAPRRRRK